MRHREQAITAVIRAAGSSPNLLAGRRLAPPAPAAAGARRFAAPLLRPLLLCSAPNPAPARQPGAPGRLTRPANSLEAGSGWPPAPAGLLAAPLAPELLLPPPSMAPNSPRDEGLASCQSPCCARWAWKAAHPSRRHVCTAAARLQTAILPQPLAGTAAAAPVATTSASAAAPVPQPHHPTEQ